MKIAVTYENGNIFQHFGHTAQFKIYNVQDGSIVSADISGTNGSGHSALAGFLRSEQVNVLICGGIGGCAVTALAQAGITLYAGNSGSADEAVEAYLRGELVQNGSANCNHHHGHGGEHSCGSHDCH